MEYHKPYIPQIQELLDSHTEKSMMELTSQSLSYFEKNTQEYIKNTTSLFLMDIILKFKAKGHKKDISEVLASDVFQKCIKENKNMQEAFENSNLENVFYAYTYWSYWYCKGNKQDVWNVFKIKA